MDADYLSLLPILGGVVIVAVATIAVTRFAADGRLARNGSAGIRTRHTQVSDRAWEAGHAAARPVALLAGWAAGLTVVVAAATALMVDVQPAVFVGMAGLAVQCGVVLRAAAVANRAAQGIETEDPSQG